MVQNDSDEAARSQIMQDIKGHGSFFLKSSRKLMKDINGRETGLGMPCPKVPLAAFWRRYQGEVSIYSERADKQQ